MTGLPSDAALAKALAAVFGNGDRTVRVISRKPGPRSSTFPSEILVCERTGDGEFELFCKYGGGVSHASFGHRGDVAYEASVYRRLLLDLPLRVPRFCGAYSLNGASEVWLFLEHVAGAQVVDAAPDPHSALARAGGWIGRFHRILAGRDAPAEFRRYDAGYYAQWARRTKKLAASTWNGRLPWLPELCSRAEQFADELAASSRAVVHGEYTPHNVLVRDGEVCPIDWESAAVGLAEIDLVSLVDKWPEDVAERCEQAYVHARWGEGAPSEFGGRLDMARLYWDLRWLGDRPEWTRSEKVGPRFEHLRATGERLGLL